jgi:hypothetical protein
MKKGLLESSKPLMISLKPQILVNSMLSSFFAKQVMPPPILS